MSINSYNNESENKELINDLINAEDEKNAVNLAFRVIKQLEDERDGLKNQLEDCYREINRLNSVILSLNQEINQINYQHSNSNIFKRNWSRMKKLLKNMRPSQIKKGIIYLKKEGFAATLRQVQSGRSHYSRPQNCISGLDNKS